MVTYYKISLIEGYVQIAIKGYFIILFGYYLTSNLTTNILTQLSSFGKRKIDVFEILFVGLEYM